MFLKSFECILGTVGLITYPTPILDVNNNTRLWNPQITGILMLFLLFLFF